ncbi:MAG: DUF4249 family protein [Bacteroidetes bacterium]|nr:DUF4249 family protein [Bacteroidota bacterium]
MLSIFNKSKSIFVCIAVLALISLTLVSCEKEVKINLNSGESQVVVEGSIESGLPPYVFLTNSIGYFATIDINTLQNSFIHGAVVTVTDGTTTATLKEYSIDTGNNGNKFYFYSIDTAVKPFFVGKIEKVYKLRIEYKGKVYESYTKIPNPTPLDSVKTVQPDAPFDTDKNPTARQFRIYFKDPDTIGNCVRYFTKRNSEPYYPGLNSVYDDQVINSIYFQTTIPCGEPRGAKYNRDSSGVAYPGDTVTIKWCAIDRSVYNFWSTYEYSLGTIGNPFSTPINVKTNISNGALGVWAGYGSYYVTLVTE